MLDKSVDKKNLHYFKSISELCKALGISKPRHPLIVQVDHSEIAAGSDVRYLLHDFYMISYKTNLNGKLKYGQGYYDFDEGGLIFVAPNQPLSVIDDSECEGHSIFVHPDFFAAHPLAKSVTKYGFFAYNINEALHLSEKEKDKILRVFNDIKDELETAIDDTSRELIISYLEVLLNYSNRYYKRQFITRKAINKPIIDRFEQALNDYYSDGFSSENGIPSVKYFSHQLNVSPGYLSDMLRNITGLNTQQHIHAKILHVAKRKLSEAELTAAEIAYDLGFSHPQSFNKLFKVKTGMTPIEYRESLN